MRPFGLLSKTTATYLGNVGSAVSAMRPAATASPLAGWEAHPCASRLSGV